VAAIGMPHSMKPENPYKFRPIRRSTRKQVFKKCEEQ
jgi:hypothetical protein